MSSGFRRFFASTPLIAPPGPSRLLCSVGWAEFARISLTRGVWVVVLFGGWLPEGFIQGIRSEVELVSERIRYY